MPDARKRGHDGLGGYWVQDGAGTVEPRLLKAVSARGQREHDSEALRLTEWLDEAVFLEVLGKQS